MTVCEVYDPEDPKNEKEEYWYLLHWGLTAGKEPAGNGTYFTSQWTVAICQNMNDGRVQTFIPDAITILGYERINEKTRDWSRPGE